LTGLRLSAFGERFTRKTGALELMDDLGRAMSGEAREHMLGGGNPAKIPAVQALLGRRLKSIAAEPAALERMLSNYAHPKGELGFRRALAALLARELGWAVTADNIALTAGSQSAFFMLFNLFGGRAADGTLRRVLLPMTPEYVGYADVGLASGMFAARRPAIEELGDGLFKYRLDVAAPAFADDIAAVCVSRPTNPTGNVLTDGEMDAIDALCRERGLPFIVDSAYGAPFPGILFVDAASRWNENVIYCLSLSKLGLPGARTGIVVAAEAVIEALTRMTAVLSLAVGSVGPVIAQPLVESGEILSLGRQEIMPFYRDKALRAVEWLRTELAGLPFRIHKPEGAFFLWLWFPGLPITSAELYARLKEAGVFVLSGHYFFPGLPDDGWRHRHECLRLSYAQDDTVVREGIRIIGRELRRVFAG